jgi:hypothetical protein
MIVAQCRQFKAVCTQRGYDLAAVMACVVSQNGDLWTIDETHDAYPRRKRQARHEPTGGPGTELKKLLSRVGITATPNCKCNARVKHMDAMEAQEPGWCERNIDTVVGYLREAAADRGLPFLDAAGRVLVRRAISNARKEAARATQAANAEGSEAKTR